MHPDDAYACPTCGSSMFDYNTGQCYHCDTNQMKKKEVDPETKEGTPSKKSKEKEL